MPIYEYEILEGDSCKACGGRFELRRPLDRPELTACPLCKKAVRKVITAPSTPKISKPLSVSDAKKAGFSVLKRRDKGVYERL
jgi:putative FmdB family regulatory protein